jgi:transcriptional regulator GlxA family with amidase domain
VEHDQRAACHKLDSKGQVLRIAEALRNEPGPTRSLAEWAAVADMNERTFGVRFRGAFGTTFGKWRQELMIARAKKQLASGLSVRAVAGDLGYLRPEAFSKRFYAMTGTWPSRYAQSASRERL